MNFKTWTGCNIQVTVKGGKRLRAVCYVKGCAFSGRAEPFINIHIPKYLMYPYKMYRSHGLKTIPNPPTFNSKDELLVYLVGHEIMHYWQCLNKAKYSEVQAEENAHLFLDYFRSQVLSNNLDNVGCGVTVTNP